MSGEGYSTTTGDYGALNVTYKLIFDAGYTSELILNAEITKPGRIALFDGCVGENNSNLLQEFSIDQTNGYEEIRLSLNTNAVETISGKRDLCIVFDNSLEIALKTFKFTQHFAPFTGDNEVNIVYIGGSVTQGAGASSSEKN